MNFKDNPLTKEQYELLSHIYQGLPIVAYDFHRFIHAYKYLMESKYIEWIPEEKEYFMTIKGMEVHDL